MKLPDKSVLQEDVSERTMWYQVADLLSESQSQERSADNLEIHSFPGPQPQYSPRDSAPPRKSNYHGIKEQENGLLRLISRARENIWDIFLAKLRRQEPILMLVHILRITVRV